MTEKRIFITNMACCFVCDFIKRSKNNRCLFYVCLQDHTKLMEAKGKTVRERWINKNCVNWKSILRFWWFKLKSMRSPEGCSQFIASTQWMFTLKVVFDEFCTLDSDIWFRRRSLFSRLKTSDKPTMKLRFVRRIFQTEIDFVSNSAETPQLNIQIKPCLKLWLIAKNDRSEHRYCSL